MNAPSSLPSQTKPFAALLTPGGRGAVATVRYCGDCRLFDTIVPPLFQAANKRPMSRQTIGRVVFGQWGTQLPEEVVVCRTEPMRLDIHCHGGEAASRRILRDLERLGCTVLSWRELACRSMGTFAAECAEALSRATTQRTVAILLQQQSGILQAALENLFSDEASDRQQCIDSLRSLLQWSEFGLHLTLPWSVVLVGRPNVGKSSLINRLVGYSRSIVYQEPGTTRDVVTVDTALEGWPIRMADTAGIRDAADTLEAAGIHRARKHVASTDCRLLLIDTSDVEQEYDRRLLADWPDAILVANKCDLPNCYGSPSPQSGVPVSSLTGEGIERLVARIVERLVPQVPEPLTPIPVTERQVELLKQSLTALENNDGSGFQSAVSEILA